MPSFNPQRADGGASFMSVHQFDLPHNEAFIGDDCRDTSIATIGLRRNPKQKMIRVTSDYCTSNFKNLLLQQRTSQE
jgi:hypothetical protein